MCVTTFVIFSLYGEANVLIIFADVGGTPLAAALFKHWNAVTKSLEAILVLSIDSGDGVLRWYRITANNLVSELFKRSYSLSLNHI